ncbi:DUF2971 domain-containing protein [Akkermansia massiliensis]|uniref:DUF2971 domain-containing protein n=1 Tax=Akkermansia massiliensis TaxID=2927224 RepID=UPI00202F2F02|nr:DUF2971 domain-containing protein [Akkermansia sp. B2-R-115]MCM0684658.1 DUF2971 domain-containing protein [Akkermansia sp. B2-R-115]
MAFIVYKRDGLAIALLEGREGDEFPQVRINQVDKFSDWKLDDSQCEGENWKEWPEEVVFHELLPLMREAVERASMYNSHEESIKSRYWGVMLMTEIVDVWEKRMREKRGVPGCLLKCFSVESAKATLNSRRIRFSHPDAYNDLMEGQCVWQRNPDADVKYEQKELDRVVEEHKKYLDRARICCFSEGGTGSMLPQWAYYANDAKGIMLAFNVDAVLKRFAPGEGKKEAIAKRRVWYVNNVQKEECFQDNLLDLYYVKHASWRHEREWRVVLDAEEDVKRLRLDVKAGNNEAGFPVMDVAFEMKDVNAVFLGPRMRPSDAEEIFKIIQGVAGNVKVYVIEVERHETYGNFRPFPIKSLEELKEFYGCHASQM